MITWILLGCAGSVDPGTTPEPSCADSGDVLSWVFTTLTLTRETEGVSRGFDLDSRVSAADDDQTCGIADFAHPDGTPGIDNGLAPLIPLMAESETGALEPALQNEINAGGLLLLLELAGVDDPTSDDCVSLRFGQAQGEPLVGGDDRLLPGQTFDWHPDHPPQVFDALTLVEGVVDSSPFALDIPFPVFDGDLRLALADARLRAELGDDGRLAGTFAGGVAVPFLLDATNQEQIDPEVYEFFLSYIYASSDLDPDAEGVCQQISMTLDYTAVSAWTYLD